MLRRFPIGSFEVISGHTSITEFCNNLNITATYIERNKDLSLDGWKQYKSKIDQTSKKWTKREIGFGFYLNSIPDLYLINQLSKQNTVWFYNTDPLLQVTNFSAIPNKKYRHQIKTILIWRWVFKIPIFVFQLDKLYIPGLKPAQLCRNYPVKIIPKVDLNIWLLNSLKITTAYNASKLDIIYIDSIVSHYPDKMPQVEYILNDLEKSGFTIGIKPHPLQIIPENLANKFTIINPALPAEFLGTIAQRAILGVASNSLNTLSEHTPTYSLARCLEFDNNWINIVKKTHLNEKIVMPKDYSELLSFINTNSFDMEIK